MKKITLLISVIIGFAFIACSSDNPKNVGGEVIVNGQSYELKNGIIVTSNDQQTFTIVLANGAVFYDPNRDYKQNPFYFSDNTTQYIQFRMHTSSSSTTIVENATYPFTGDNPNFDYNNPYLQNIEFCVNLITVNGNQTSCDYIDPDYKNGEVTLKKIGDAYKIVFSYYTDENSISGTFFGPINTIAN